MSEKLHALCRKVAHELRASFRMSEDDAEDAAGEVYLLLSGCWREKTQAVVTSIKREYMDMAQARRKGEETTMALATRQSKEPVEHPQQDFTQDWQVTSQLTETQSLTLGLRALGFNTLQISLLSGLSRSSIRCAECRGRKKIEKN